MRRYIAGCGLCMTQPRKFYLLLSIKYLILEYFRLYHCVPLQVICMHLLYHIVPGIQQYGPVYGMWMFSFKWINSWMCVEELLTEHILRQP